MNELCLISRNSSLQTNGVRFPGSTLALMLGAPRYDVCIGEEGAHGKADVVREVAEV